ncbi:response regulator [Streptomyces malaysiensis subsp. malaysiensis]|uniref:response regulator transcription factor n=1 Tax=Streptomyces malaysiensis TaxID=92644 RepID=UPI0024C0B1E6|nr:response regulator [Streptomyces sp. NA07423]WHX19629.1 response regulator [Streptomyces sp. NA07423]
MVDDSLSMAEQLADLIHLQTGLPALACSRPEAAISAIQEHPIKVVLLDQKMPMKSGTDLYREIREINPSAKAVMVTGEANSSEVGQALSLGFSDYLAKGDVSRLCEIVLKWYFQYEVDQASELQINTLEPLFRGRRRFFLVGDQVRYYLAAIQVVDSAYVLPESWSTIQQINAGQEKKFTFSASTKETFIVESSQQYNVKGSLSSEVARKSKIGARIESVVTRTVKKSRTSEITVTDSIEETYRLPEESSDPAENYVKSRHIESAPVYKRLRLSIVKSCSCCREDAVIPVMVLVFDDAYATRQTDYYRDGSSDTIDTGQIRLPR